MNRMTRSLLVLVVASLLLIGVGACGSDDDNGNNGDSTEDAGTQDAGGDAEGDTGREESDFVVTIFDSAILQPAQVTVEWGVSNEGDASIELSECTWEVRNTEEDEDVDEGVALDSAETIEAGVEEDRTTARFFDASIGDPPNCDTTMAEVELTCTGTDDIGEFTSSASSEFEWYCP